MVKLGECGILIKEMGFSLFGEEDFVISSSLSLGKRDNVESRCSRLKENVYDDELN